MGNVQRIRWALAILLLGAAAQIRADGPSREYQLKAAFIYNFAQFIEWPDKAFTGAQSPIVITVLGDNPFGNVLDQVTKGKQIRGREIVIKYVKDPAAVGQTHILFVGAPHNQNPGAVLRGLTGVLTIADTDSFMGAGGMIRFFSEENKLRFEINTKATDKAGLKVSAKLLQLAKVYKDD
jgi:hypothetical protein